MRNRRGRKSFARAVASGCVAAGPLFRSRLHYVIGIVEGLNESEGMKAASKSGADISV